MEAIETALWPAATLTSAFPFRLRRHMEGRIARAKDASPEDVFRGLVEAHSRMVFRLAYRLTGNEHDAEDVVQEAFLKAYRHCSRFDSRASFATWIHRIATNCAIDLLRRKSRRIGWGGSDGAVVAEDLPSHRPGTEAGAQGAEVEARVAQALDTLTPSERAAFVLRHFEGQSIEEIARALRVRGNTAKQTVFRAVQKMRRRLAPLVEKHR